ncbi:MAG TPA: RpiB/LacA/LacB family sugar-phosphate isomerase [Terriglobales bacterium]|nr:RpiB/LacA/LacB family sugar-phosphate isomerase [Terriglobales bacterium]
MITILFFLWLTQSRTGSWIAGLPFAEAVLAHRLRQQVPGIRAALIHDHFSAKQGDEDDPMNILCIGGRTVGPVVAWDLVQTL